MTLSVNLSRALVEGKTILSNISFELEQGRFLAICGKNSYEGKIIKKGKLSFVFQDHLLLPWLSLKDNIAFGLNTQNETSSIDFLRLIGLEQKSQLSPSNFRW